MLRVLLLLSLVVITTVCVIYYQNPSVRRFSIQKLVNPITWAKMEIVEEKPIGSIKDVFQSELVWQMFEQLIGFVTGVLICVLIGWRVSSYRNIYEKSFENSLNECLRRQTRFEKHLSALELQIVDFEREYLFSQKEITVRCDSCTDTMTFNKKAKQSTTDEVDEVYIKDNENDENEGLVCQEVDIMMKQDIDEKNFECILAKLTKILERLTKLSKEKFLPALERSNGLVQEQEVEIYADDEECHEKESSEVENKIEEIEETSEKIDENEYQNTTCAEEVVETNYLCSEGGCEENIAYELHPCKSKEEISNVMISIAGAGECDETFRGKIVPVSQIPKYQEFRKGPKQRGKPQKESDDEKSIPFITSRNTPDQATSERGTPQTSPRKNNPSPRERAASHGGRRKQRS